MVLCYSLFNPLHILPSQVMRESCTCVHVTALTVCHQPPTPRCPGRWDYLRAPVLRERLCLALKNPCPLHQGQVGTISAGSCSGQADTPKLGALRVGRAPVPPDRAKLLGAEWWGNLQVPALPLLMSLPRMSFPSWAAIRLAPGLRGGSGSPSQQRMGVHRLMGAFRKRGNRRPGPSDPRKPNHV